MTREQASKRLAASARDMPQVFRCSQGNVALIEPKLATDRKPKCMLIWRYDIPTILFPVYVILALLSMYRLEGNAILERLMILVEHGGTLPNAIVKPPPGMELAGKLKSSKLCVQMLGGWHGIKKPHPSTIFRQQTVAGHSAFWLQMQQGPALWI